MDLEKQVLNSITEAFADSDIPQPKVWFEYGTLWADNLDPISMLIVKKAVETIVCTDHNTDIEVTKFDPTEKEPWTHWAFDF